MKRKIITVVCLLAAALLIPIPMRMKDGGTVKYRSALYCVSDVHRLAPSETDGYEDGIIIEILGMQVYHNVDRKTETVPFRNKVVRKADLSPETLKWLENYNQLSEEDQLAISYIPHDLYELSGYQDMTDIPAETE